MKSNKLLPLAMVMLFAFTACDGSNTSDVELDHIQVTAESNTKLNYVAGETFDLAGVTVLAYYSDETSQSVTRASHTAQTAHSVSLIRK